MVYWQLMNGDQTRDYSDIFLRFGVACIGPGEPGPFVSENFEKYRAIEEFDKIKPILEIKEGDRIVLKNGQREIHAVGEVVSFENTIYNYSSFFDDIDGWDLHHFVKVRWKKIQHVFDEISLTRSTLTRVSKPEVISFIESVWDKVKFEESEMFLSNFDSESLEFELGSLEDYLISLGMKIDDAEDVNKTVQRVVRLARWYLEKFDKEDDKFKPSEHEIRTSLVVPFFYALGWSPQKMGIETNCPGNNKRIDMLLYENADRKKPLILVETKTMFTGSKFAIEQAKAYAVNIDELNKIVVTDGLRFWLLEKNENQWRESAYMNFLNLKKSYSCYPGIGGPLELIKKLIP